MAGVLQTNHWFTLKPLEVRKSIHAFLTITTMLSFVKRARTSNHANPSSLDEEHQRQLNALNALATVLMMDSGAVAVAAKPGSQSRRFEIVACVCIAQHQEELATIQAPQGIGHTFWNWLTSSLRQKSTNDVPTIFNPSPLPGNLGDTSTASQLEDYIDSEL